MEKIFDYDHAKRQAIKEFHTLLGKYSLGADAKEGILSGFGVEHTNELTLKQLRQACASLREMHEGKGDKHIMDLWRKRAIAAAFAMAGELGYTMTMEGAKAMVLRATGNEYSNFNKIPQARLQGIYNGFTANTRDMRHAVRVALELKN